MSYTIKKYMVKIFDGFQQIQLFWETFKIQGIKMSFIYHKDDYNEEILQPILYLIFSKFMKLITTVR